MGAVTEEDNMSDQKVDLTCKHCGDAFSTFLSEMAEQNRKVTCPGCGKVNEYSSADILKRSS
jgi:Zn finger protein HypA/HybF involved in hydrogenase expression